MREWNSIISTSSSISSRLVSASVSSRSGRWRSTGGNDGCNGFVCPNALRVSLSWSSGAIVNCRGTSNSSSRTCCFENSFRHAVRRIGWPEVNPFQRHLPSEPGHLPFGKLPGADLHEFDGFRQRPFSPQMLYSLPVPQRLHRSFIFREAVFQQLAGLSDEAT